MGLTACTWEVAMMIAAKVLVGCGVGIIALVEPEHYATKNILEKKLGVINLHSANYRNPGRIRAGIRARIRTRKGNSPRTRRMAEPAVADEAKPAVAVANAVAPVAAAPATVAAAPANAVAVAIPAAGPHLPAKKWSSELCDCTNDCGICCVGFCCEFVAAPQLYERIIKAPGSCQKFGAILLALFVLTWVSSLLNQANVGPYLINTDWGGFLPIWGPVGNLVELTFTVVVTWLICTVRAKIREQDEIRADSCSDAED